MLLLSVRGALGVFLIHSEDGVDVFKGEPIIKGAIIGRFLPNEDRATYNIPATEMLSTMHFSQRGMRFAILRKRPVRNIPIQAVKARFLASE